jgi:hypothetical protein
MTLQVEQRASDSLYVEAVMHGYSLRAGSTIRPAESHWHMVFVREHGNLHPLVVGPWTTAGNVAWQAGGEILWIKFKLGTFMPHCPAQDFLNSETPLPQAACNKFWLHSSAWQAPSFDNADTFVDHLVRAGALLRDPLVDAVLHDRPHDLAPRTIRHRFLQATGLTQSHIRQHERALQAARLLQQGISILDTTYELGYYDQPHLTRSLKHFIGHTPAQLIQMSQAEAGGSALLSPA